MGAPVQLTLGDLEPGQLLKVQWRGQTIGVLRRSGEMLTEMGEITGELRDPDSEESEQPSFARNSSRARPPTSRTGCLDFPAG